MRVPPHVKALARQAIELHDPDVAVTPLVSDSLVDRPSSPDRRRRLVFADDDVRIEMVTTPGGHLDITVLPRGARVAVLGLDRLVPVEVDASGEAHADHVQGLVTALVQRAGTGGTSPAPTRTAWMRI